MIKSSRRSGFTLVELNLAILFIAMLLLAVVATTIYVSRLYNYGVAMKSINQVGREVVDQMRRDIASSNPAKLQTGTILVDGQDFASRVCFGSVSYVTNPALLLENDDPTLVKDPGGTEPISMVRIENDATAAWCDDGGGGAFTRTDLTASDVYTELLPADAVPIAIHSLMISLATVSDDASKGLAQLYLQVGTNEVGTTEDGRCKPPTEVESNFDNCAVREFETVVRMSGKTEVGG